MIKYYFVDIYFTFCCYLRGGGREVIIHDYLI